MFQADLSYMVRREQHQDYVREAERERMKKTGRGGPGHTWPPTIVLLVALAVLTYALAQAMLIALQPLFTALSAYLT